MEFIDRNERLIKQHVYELRADVVYVCRHIIIKIYDAVVFSCDIPEQQIGNKTRHVCSAEIYGIATCED